MNILLVGPKHHGMGQQLKILYESLRLNREVELIDWIGSDNHYFTEVEIRQSAQKVVNSADWNRYDIAYLHYGKLETEQLIPLLLREQKSNLKCQFVYSVHSLRSDIFEMVQPPNPELQEQINLVTKGFFNSYIYYGSFAQQIYGQAGCTIFIHEQHSHISLTAKKWSDLSKKFHALDTQRAYVVVLGYASPWKDYQTLLGALELINSPLVLIVAGPSWQKRFGFKHRRINQVDLYIVDKHLDDMEFAFLCRRTDFAIFPYIPHETFQGSGVLPNLIFNGKANIVTNIANLPEMLGDTGIVIPAQKPSELAEAIDKLVDTKTRAIYESKVQARSHLFSRDYHVDSLIKHFKTLLT